jgi:hypothetical protein
MNYTSDLKDQILQAEEPVKYYLRKVFLHVLEDKLLQEAIIANLFFEQQIPRYNKIMATLKEICAQP